MMKNKVEVAANVAVILLAVMIGSVFLKDRFASPGPAPNEVKVGDQLPGLHVYNWRAHERPPVRALRTGCPFGAVSRLFFRHPAKLDHSNHSPLHPIPPLHAHPPVLEPLSPTQ